MLEIDNPGTQIIVVIIAVTSLVSEAVFVGVMFAYTLRCTKSRNRNESESSTILPQPSVQPDQDLLTFNGLDTSLQLTCLSEKL